MNDTAGEWKEAKTAKGDTGAQVREFAQRAVGIQALYDGQSSAEMESERDKFLQGLAVNAMQAGLGSEVQSYLTRFGATAKAERFLKILSALDTETSRETASEQAGDMPPAEGRLPGGLTGDGPGA